jgi:hypothetical protein
MSSNQCRHVIGKGGSTGRFQLGRVVQTPGIALRVALPRVLECLRRHVAGDWGHVDEEGRADNVLALTASDRILSVYPIDSEQDGADDNLLWIITEADRSSTCVLLPEEY